MHTFYILGEDDKDENKSEELQNKSSTENIKKINDNRIKEEPITKNIEKTNDDKTKDEKVVGLFETNTQGAINAIGNEGGWKPMPYPIVIDSGASETVIPKTWCTEHKLKDSIGSKNGVTYTAATGEIIENEVERELMGDEMVPRRAPRAQPPPAPAAAVGPGALVPFGQDVSVHPRGKYRCLDERPHRQLV